MKILVIGGTGTLGHAILPLLRDQLSPGDRIRILSRDEHKLQAMEKKFKCWQYGKTDFSTPNEKYAIDFISGDVRDRRRMISAMDGIDYVYHFAAMKTVDGAEYNPQEAVKTNIDGTRNVIWACHKTAVKKCVFTSTDKAVAPINMYGKTKAVAEDIIVKGNIGKGEGRCKFAAVRYGNVIGSTGSVFEKWDKQETLEVTNPDMTRFWWLPSDAATFVKMAMDEMDGGEVFIPYLKSSTLYQLAQVYSKPTKIVGVRPGEKMHESLFTKDESYCIRSWDKHKCFIKYPSYDHFKVAERGEPLPRHFDYNSLEGTGKWERYSARELTEMLIESGLCEELEAREWLKRRFV